MRHLLVTVLWSTVFAVLRPAAAVSAPSTWILSWEDDFEGGSLNTTLWTVEHNHSHCCDPFGKDELQLYVRDAVTVQDGELRVQTRYNPTPGVHHDGSVGFFEFTSGYLSTKRAFAQRLGRFVANCSLPPRAARGVWPAFWMLPDAPQCWPTGGEIDIFEMLADPLEDNVWGSFHHGTTCGHDLAPIPGKSVRPAATPRADRDWQTRWHLYEVQWFADRIEYYLDEQLYWTRRAQDVPLPTSPMYIIFDQAVDQTIFSPTKFTPAYQGEGVHLRVAWVRAYVASA